MKPLIFLVEDDADISRLVRHHLEAAGYAVRAFPAAGAVLGEAEKEHPSLFLLDIMVPGGDGLDLCRRIRQMPMLGMTPVIFLTAKRSLAALGISAAGSRSPSLGSGALTPAKRLKFVAIPAAKPKV